MSNNNTNNTNNANNQNLGLIASIWGPNVWRSLHLISFGYPVNPTNEDKKHYKTFFETLGYVLPCETCREHYRKMIKEEPNLLTDKVFENRATLTRWVYELHNAVNRRLCVHYDISYEDVVTLYESFRAKCDPNKDGCVMPDAERKKSYCNAYKKEYPVVPYRVAKCFEQYALARGVDFSHLNIVNNLIVNKIKNDEWDKRNEICDNLIKTMREDGINSLETSGKYKGLPTVEELKLISYMGSSMNLNKFVKPAEILGYDIKKKYRFSNNND